jgi:hypothetical protein
MIAADKPPLAEAYLAHISMRPWSEYTAADYSIEQWHNACLIHQHQGPPTSKNQCKLPVKTPNGTVNKNGVHAAAAALAGARGGVNASDAEKASARTALVRLYGQLDEDPPPGLAKHSDMDDAEMLAHFGIKGMRWGTRRSSDTTVTKGVTPNSQNRSSAKKVAVTAVTAAAGAAAIALLLSKTGRNTIKSMFVQSAEQRYGARKMGQAKTKVTNGLLRDAGIGRKRVSDISQSEWRSRVSSVLGDMKEANAEQDAYMRSIGLGAVVNRGGS